jgi:hypothetical protein
MITYDNLLLGKNMTIENQIFTAYSDETVHPIPGQTEQLFL